MVNIVHTVHNINTRYIILCMFICVLICFCGNEADVQFCFVSQQEVETIVSFCLKIQIKIFIIAQKQYLENKSLRYSKLKAMYNYERNTSAM